MNMKNSINYLKLIRIKHWFKNFLIFLPAIFGGVLLDKNISLNLFLGFLCFSFIASCIYVYNDISDIENDKKHPVKKHRPLAAGNIPIKNAYLLLIFLFIISSIIIIFISFKLSNYLIVVIPYFYLVLNILYSKKLKNYPIIDVFILSLDYILRLLYGSLISEVAISNWLYLVVMFASLFMGFGKRRTEYEKGTNTRRVLKKYNINFLDKSMYLSMNSTIVFYSLWAIDSSNKVDSNKYLKYSIPIVVLILFLYSYIIESNDCNDGDPIEILFSSKWLIFLSFIYCLFMLIILYGGAI